MERHGQKAENSGHKIDSDQIELVLLICAYRGHAQRQEEFLLSGRYLLGHFGVLRLRCRGQAGAEIGEHFVVDVSIGQHWAKYWADNGLEEAYGGRDKYPHRYPDSHPQARSNPQESWCYPIAALGDYREWLQSTYVEGGKFAHYLKGKVSRGELPPSVAQLAIATLVPPQLEQG